MFTNNVVQRVSVSTLLLGSVHGCSPDTIRVEQVGREIIEYALLPNATSGKDKIPSVEFIGDQTIGVIQSFANDLKNGDSISVVEVSERDARHHIVISTLSSSEKLFGIRLNSAWRQRKFTIVGFWSIKENITSRPTPALMSGHRTRETPRFYVRTQRAMFAQKPLRSWAAEHRVMLTFLE